jgi:hypothetical protein
MTKLLSLPQIQVQDARKGMLHGDNDCMDREIRGYRKVTCHCLFVDETRIWPMDRPWRRHSTFKSADC